jgi:hypothetical protein
MADPLLDVPAEAVRADLRLTLDGGLNRGNSSVPSGRKDRRLDTMKHPAFLLVPVFMFADYFLTLAGAVLKDRKYGDHFKTEHYELNPIWQKDVARKKWLNPRQIALVVVGSCLVILPMEFVELPEPFVQGVLGCLLAVLGMVIGRHLSNLMIFRYVIRKPDEISGQVTLTHSLLLSWSLYQNLAVLVPLALIAVFSPSPLVIGACVGAVLVLAVHWRWIRKHRKRARASTQPSGS